MGHSLWALSALTCTHARARTHTLHMYGFTRLYTQDGFGWTNGVALWLLDRYAQSFERALREDGEHDDSAKK